MAKLLKSSIATNLSFGLLLRGVLSCFMHDITRLYGDPVPLTGLYISDTQRRARFAVSRHLKKISFLLSTELLSL